MRVHSQTLARCQGCEAHQQVSILIKTKALLVLDPENWPGSQNREEGLSTVHALDCAEP